MSKNDLYVPGWDLSVAVSDPTAPVSGDAVRYGALTGIALTDKGEGGNEATKTTVYFGTGVFNLPVKAEAAAISEGDALFYDDGIHAVNNDSINGYFFGFAMAAVLNGATSTIAVLHVPSPGAGTLASLSVTAAKIANATITEAKLVENSLTGTVVGNTANANVVGGIEVVHRVDIAAGALGNTDVTLTHKTRVIDAWLVLRGAGVASCTLQVKNGTTAITDAMAASGADKALVRCASLDDASWEIAAGGTLRVTSAAGATQPDATVFVRGIRVA
jgi:predicted RecA/RadA family phage recombinase